MITFDSHSTDPYYNLAFEEFVFTRFREEDVFLLWRNTPCMVVGSYQNICREVRAARLWRMGIPVLRRISGGGAVYHDLGNVNYSCITRQEGGVDYGRSLAPILEALNGIGVPARKNRASDIAIGEKKISGSAQRSAGGRLLHHGTLLFDAGLEALEEISVRGKNDCVRTKGTQSAICPVTNIRLHLAEDMTVEEFQRRLLDRMVPDAGDRRELTAEEAGEVRRLRDGKYRSWAWTWGRTPAFVYERSGSFAGMPFRAAYSARQGIVAEAAIDCPAVDGALAARLLNGARLCPEGFAEICGRLAGERGQELLELLL